MVEISPSIFSVGLCDGRWGDGRGVLTLAQRDVCDDSLDVDPGLASGQANKDAWDDQQVVQSVSSPHQHVALQVPSYKK